MPAVEWTAVGRGAAVALAIAVPAIVIEAVIDLIVGIDRDSNVVLPFYVIVFAGLVLGGWSAGRQRPDSPLTHGALAALAAYAVLAVAVTAVRLGQGDGVDAVALLFNAFMAASAGILGGVVASRRPVGSGPAPPG